jgi:hypothetical protein
MWLQCTDEDQEEEMALLEDKGTALRKKLVPAAAGIAGAGAGLFLTRKKKLGDSLHIGERGVGELAEDLRAKLDAVLAKADLSSGAETSPVSARSRQLKPDELEKRLREREQRRNRRRAAS